MGCKIRHAIGGSSMTGEIGFIRLRSGANTFEYTYHFSRKHIYFPASRIQESFCLTAGTEIATRTK